MKRTLITALLLAACPGLMAQTPDSVTVVPVQTDSAVVSAPDSIETAALREMARQDSVLRAARLRDSLRIAREDSLERVMARVDSLVQFAEDYMQDYRFDKAAEYLGLVRKLCPDETLKALVSVREKQALTARGLTISAFVPKVVARERFSVDDFHLYYPLPDSSWRPADAHSDVYCPDRDVDTLYLDGRLYPMTFGDRLYFSSDTLPGLGGYDIFRCDWDPEAGEWGEPHNIGFPFNSSADDFLYVENPDGRYSLLSSNREDVADSVTIYVFEREAKWKSVRVDDSSSLRRMSRLDPTADPDQLDLGTVDSFSDADARIVRSGAYTFFLKSRGPKVGIVLPED